MKVDNPKFNPAAGYAVFCRDCPFTHGTDPCNKRRFRHNCPTAANYKEECTEACRLAEQANKGE